EYACLGKIISYEYPFVVSLVSGGKIKIFHLQTRLVTATFSQRKVLVSDFQDGIFVYQANDGKIIGIDVERGVELFKTQGLPAVIGLKIINKDRFVAQADREKVLLMSTKNGQVIKEDTDCSLYLYSKEISSSKIQCGNGKYIIFHGSLNEAFDERRTRLKIADSNSGQLLHEFAFDTPIEKVHLLENRLIVQLGSS